MNVLEITQLPPNWKLVKLDEVVKFQGGSQPPKSVFAYEETAGYIRLIQIRDFRTDKFKTYIPIKQAKRFFEKDDIMIGRYGPPLFQILRGLSGSFNVALMKAIPKEDLDRDYLYYLLNASKLQSYVITNSQRTAGQTGVNLDLLNGIQIPLPPLPEQKRIAEVLDKADALREKRRLALQKLDTLLQSVFLEMFGDPVKNPKGWDLISLNDLVIKPLQNGAYFPKEFYTEASDEGVEMIHMSDAFYGIVERGNLKRVKASEKEIKKYQVNSQDLLVARRSLNYEGSALPCRIPLSKENIIFESSMIRVSPDESKIRTIYLYHFLKNERARVTFVFPFITKSTISGINQSNLAKVKIIVPEIKVQNDFEKVFWQIEAMKQKESHTLMKTENLFQSLQQRAFKGELFSDKFPLVEPQTEKIWRQTSLP